MRASFTPRARFAFACAAIALAAFLGYFLAEAKSFGGYTGLTFMLSCILGGHVGLAFSIGHGLDDPLVKKHIRQPKYSGQQCPHEVHARHSHAVQNRRNPEMFAGVDERERIAQRELIPQHATTHRNAKQARRKKNGSKHSPRKGGGQP